MKKKFSVLGVMAAMLLLLAGCSATTSKSYTFSVATGDMVKISLDTSDQFDITSDVPFVISQNGETLSQGIFLTAEDYQAYVDAVSADENAVVLDSGNKDGNAYTFWSYQDTEFDYVIMVQDSQTGILIGSNVSEEAARECFERLSISLE